VEAVMTSTPITQTLSLDQTAQSMITGMGVVRGALAEVRLGNEAFHAYLAQLIREAKVSVIDYVIPEGRPDPHDREILRAYATALRNGVSTRTLISPEHLAMVQRTYDPDFDLNTFLARMPHIRVVEQVHAPFTVIDGERVLLNVKDPLAPDEYIISVCVWDSELARLLTDKFEVLWASARSSA
jgi:hypothetical protein